jgi:hypothetical protein
MAVDPELEQDATLCDRLFSGKRRPKVYNRFKRRVRIMPKLVRLYIVNVLIGFALALVFVIGLVWLDVANLRHLILDTSSGPLAFVLLVLSNGVVFAGVQFGIAVMRLAEDDRGPKGGRGVPLATRIPIRVEATAARPQARLRR